MKQMLRILIVLATVIPLPSVGRAEVGAENGAKHPPGKHSHRSPHGGQMASVGSYHFELVIHEGEIHLYLFNQGMTPLPVEGVTGNVEILLSLA
jgi:hypothetical protein